MKRIVQYKVFVLLMFLVSSSNLYTQTLLKEVSLKQQIENSNLIIEGKVISKKSFWDSENKYIYTVNTVEVYKVFKGELVSQIEIITVGGTIGLKCQMVTHSLKLQEEDLGIFILNNHSVSALTGKIITKVFRVHGDSQGFYKYNIHENLAVNPFNKKKDISNSFYDEIMYYTKSKYIEVSRVDIASDYLKTFQGKVALGATIINFSPTTTTAGTQSSITINGTGFGTTKGKVSFSNADDGGSTYVNALDSQVLNWSDNQITVQVPSEAGTGKIKVSDASLISQVSTGTLEVSYSEINAIFEVPTGSGSYYAYPTRHVNNDGSGGYIWRMQTAFNANTSAKTSFLSAFDKWRCITNVNWTIGQVVANDAENINSIRFDNGELPNSTLGQTTYSFNGCGTTLTNIQAFLQEVDILFNADEAWYYGSGLPNPGLKIDFESVALHELGHAHQLGHVIDNSSPFNYNGNDVMHYVLGYNGQQRTLASNNIIAANDVQNRSESSIPSFSCFSGKFPMSPYSCSLSIEEEELNNAINIYPNPTKGSFNIKNESLIRLEKVVVYDISGRLISEYDMKNSSRIKTINLIGISKGMYFINVFSEKAMITKKLVLE